MTIITGIQKYAIYAFGVNTPLRDHIAGLDMKVAFRGGERPYINLDNAASTPPLKSVLTAIHQSALVYSSVHRGNGFKSRLSTGLYESARKIIREFVNAHPDDHVVIFSKNTTDAINKVAYRLNLRKKDIVLISHLEHHSNDLPWRAKATVKRIAVTSEGAIDRADFMRLLARYAGRIKLVAISGASNVTGHLPQIHWFARQAHRAGSQILVDAAQLAAHRRIDIRALDQPDHIDYLALSAHKMYAPFGAGALIARRDTFENGKPEYSGGGTVNLVTNTSIDWAMPPNRDEAGSPNVIGAIALAQAARALQRIGFDVIARHETTITQYALTRLKEVPGLTIFGSTNPAHAATRCGVIPFIIQGVAPHLVAAILGFEWGIGVRSGCFCAHPYVMSLLGLTNNNVATIQRHIAEGRRNGLPGMVRASIGIYTDRSEIDRLIEALQAICGGDYGAYTLDKTTGFYAPTGKTEDFKSYQKKLGLL